MRENPYTCKNSGVRNLRVSEHIGVLRVQVESFQLPAKIVRVEPSQDAHGCRRCIVFGELTRAGQTVLGTLGDVGAFGQFAKNPLQGCGVHHARP